MKAFAVLTLAGLALCASGCLEHLSRYDPLPEVVQPEGEVPLEQVHILESEPAVPYEELGELVIQEGRRFSGPIEESAIKLLRESAAENGCDHVWIRSTNRTVKRSLINPSDVTVSLIKIRATCIRLATAAGDTP